MKSKTITISIITVTHNCEKFIDKYFLSILNQNFIELEIIIIDSQSEENTIKFIEKYKNKYKNIIEIKLFKYPENIGYAKGTNKGVERATGKYVFILGPDTKLDKNCLINIVKAVKKIKIEDFILICRQKNYETGEFLIDGVCTDIFQFPYKIYNSDFPNNTKPPFYCDGTAIVLPKKTFIKLGNYDEELYVFCDDIDLSWKAHLMKIPLMNVPNAVVFHFGGGAIKGGIRKKQKYETTYQRRYLGEKNTIRNFLKNYSFLTLIWILPIYLLINIVEILIFTLFGRFKVAYQYFKAWNWNLSNIRSTINKRNWIQSRRKITDIELLKKLYFGSGKFNAFISIKIPTFE